MLQGRVPTVNRGGGEVVVVGGEHAPPADAPAQPQGVHGGGERERDERGERRGRVVVARRRHPECARATFCADARGGRAEALMRRVFLHRVFIISGLGFAYVIM